MYNDYYFFSITNKEEVCGRVCGSVVLFVRAPQWGGLMRVERLVPCSNQGKAHQRHFPTTPPPVAGRDGAASV